LEEINFQNTEIAFASKTPAKLRKAYWLFYSMKYPTLSKFGIKCIKLAFKIGLPISSLIKATIFDQFCGGESIGDCDDAISHLGKSNIGTILDYSVEGEKNEKAFSETANEIIQTILKAKFNPHIPFSVFKLTGIASFDLLQKIQSKEKLTDKEKTEFEDVKLRMNAICKTAYESDVPVFIDAEETWIQHTIDDLAHEMMALYNTEKAIVYNTIQFYRKDGVENIKTAYQKALDNGYCYAVKMVRGAYMEQERARAEDMNYPSPIHDTKKDSDNCYNEGLHFCAQHHKQISFCAGTHNEESSKLLSELIAQYKIVKDSPSVFFAQLYGMSDHISFNLSAKGYNVAKYVPYGPVKSVMPYLFRRAEENTSIAGQTGRELLLIQQEMKRRRL